MSMPPISARDFEALNRAYHLTEYRIHIPSDMGKDEVIPIFLSDLNHRLDSLLSQFHVSTAVWITPFNPLSEAILSEEENAIRLEHLKHIVSEQFPSKHFVSGFGHDPSGQWPDEHALFIFGVSREEGLALAVSFKQNAYIYYQRCNSPEIVWTRDISLQKD